MANAYKTPEDELSVDQESLVLHARKALLTSQKPTELLEILIKKFHLDINMRMPTHNDTLLYTAYKNNMYKLAHALIVNGAKVNTCFGKDPFDRKLNPGSDAIGYMSLLDVLGDLPAEERDYLDFRGAISFAYNPHAEPDERGRKRYYMIDQIRTFVKDDGMCTIADKRRREYYSLEQMSDLVEELDHPLSDEVNKLLCELCPKFASRKKKEN